MPGDAQILAEHAEKCLNLPTGQLSFLCHPARRADVDARLYGLTRDELRYLLDPADTRGPDYPTETFRVLKTNGKYGTRRLVLEARDRDAAEWPEALCGS